MILGRCRHKKGNVSIFLSHLLLLDIPNNRADEVGGAHVLLVFGFVERFLTPKKNKYYYFILTTTWTEVIQGTRGTLIESYVGIKYYWIIENSLHVSPKGGGVPLPAGRRLPGPRGTRLFPRLHTKKWKHKTQNTRHERKMKT